MALKGDRHEVVTDISFFMNEAGKRGGLVVFNTADFGSGAALDQSVALVTYNVATSGSKVAGLLLNDMVNIDQTRQHVNFHKDEVVVGQKVTLGKQGWWVTDQIASGITLSPGDKAYLQEKAGAISQGQGRITNVKHTTGGEAVTPLVGTFLSKKDEDGYAKVYLNLV
jgi:hypothetical protein